MTVEEAKKKWCPMVRCLNGESDEQGVAATNCDHIRRIPDVALCVADACMMWREYEITKHAEGSKFTTTEGCCGLAAQL